MPRLPALPGPPGTLPSITLLRWDADLWRIQNSDQVRYGTYPTPRYRFDAPHGEYPLIYACDSALGTFAEVYGERARRLGIDEGQRYLVHFMPRAPLWLVDLHDIQLLATLRLDERISVGDNYRACQAWALAFYRQLPQASGIRYRARKAGATVSNVALFADRCGELLDIATDTDRLESRATLVLRAAAVYNLIVKFPLKAP